MELALCFILQHFTASPFVGARSRLRSFLSPAAFMARYAARLQPRLLSGTATLFLAAGAITLPQRKNSFSVMSKSFKMNFNRIRNFFFPCFYKRSSRQFELQYNMQREKIKDEVKNENFIQKTK
jgi:hypothetical protein